MRQGWKGLALGATLALTALAALPLATPREADVMAAAKASTPREAKAKSGQRQFTGIVTALDHQSLTVEKRGKKPQTRVFSRHAELKTTGDLAKDARVTVYYRDEGGQAVATRVVVKPDAAAPAGDR